MKIGVFGSNSRAIAIGRLLVDAGYQVCFGDAKDLRSAQSAAERAGAVADTPYNDAAVCEMLIFAGSREKVDDVLARAGCIPPHAVVVDAMEGARNGANGSDALARKLDTHRLVRALIVLPQPGANILYCGDDADAMTLVEEVFRMAGCVTTYRGPLANAAEITPPDTTSTGEIEFQRIEAANAV